LSKKYPFVEEESEEEQNRGLEKLKFLKSLSRRSEINDYKDLIKVILTSFCLIPKCTHCSKDRRVYTEDCGHDR
jgi:hypothetical protein